MARSDNLHDSTLQQAPAYVESDKNNNQVVIYDEEPEQYYNPDNNTPNVGSSGTTHYFSQNGRPLYANVKGQRRPVQLTFCPRCQAQNTQTRTRTHPNGATWAAFGVTLLVFWPVCWVPFVMDSMKQTDHYCQSCGEKVGKVKPMEGVGVKERS